MGATEFESVSGYHFGPKRKQLKPRNWQLQLLFVLFFEKKIPQNTVLGHEAKMFSALWNSYWKCSSKLLETPNIC